MDEKEKPKSKIYYDENGKLIYYPFDDFKNRAKIIFDSKDKGEIVIEANTLLHVIIDYLSENPLDHFSTKSLRYGMFLDGRFLDYDYYSTELSARIGKKLSYMVRHYPSKITATKDHDNYEVYENYAYYVYQIIEPFTKKKKQPIIYA